MQTQFCPAMADRIAAVGVPARPRRPPPRPMGVSDPLPRRRARRGARHPHRDSMRLCHGASHRSRRSNPAPRAAAHRRRDSSGMKILGGDAGGGCAASVRHAVLCAVSSSNARIDDSDGLLVTAGMLGGARARAGPLRRAVRLGIRVGPGRLQPSGPAGSPIGDQASACPHGPIGIL